MKIETILQITFTNYSSQSFSPTYITTMHLLVLHLLHVKKKTPRQVPDVQPPLPETVKSQQFSSPPDDKIEIDLDDQSSSVGIESRGSVQ